jgi:hypothetical protein
VSWRLFADFKGAQHRWARIRWMPPRRSPLSAGCPPGDRHCCECGGSRHSSGVSPATGAFPTAAAAAAARLVTTQQPADALASGHWVGQPSVDVMARPTAAGFREPGLLLNGLAGGGAEDIDLNPSARRVLHAQQMLLGTRAAGPLLITPPPGELPPASSYPPPLVGPPTAPPPYPSPVPHARIQGTPDGVHQPSPYSTAQRSKQQAGGASSSGWHAEMQLALRDQSDSLCTPYSSGQLGSFWTYRGVPFPPDL